jgi:hypothetical protein
LPIAILKERFSLPFQFWPLRFCEDIPDRVYRQRYRVPRSVVDFLEQRIGPELELKKTNPKGLTPRQRVYFVV